MEKMEQVRQEIEEKMRQVRQEIFESITMLQERRVPELRGQLKALRWAHDLLEKRR